jgi:hypothetical protein
MKKLFSILAVILMAACATAPTTGDEGRSYTVYEYPDAKDKGTLPVYRVKEMPNGEVLVCDYGNPFEYKYRVTPDGRVYKPGNPFEPVGESNKRGK